MEIEWKSSCGMEGEFPFGRDGSVRSRKAFRGLADGHSILRREKELLKFGMCELYLAKAVSGMGSGIFTKLNRKVS